MNETSSQGLLTRVWSWLKAQIAREVPAEDALCEFDCRKEQCRYDEWATCERRLSHAAGELMPKQSPEDER